MSGDGERTEQGDGSKPGIKDRIAGWHPVLAHVIRTLDHYGAHRGNLAAGGATYFGFLSFFPLLAVSFAVVGQLSEIYPDAQQDFVDALSGVLPGIVSVDPQPGRIALTEIASNAPAIYTVGLLTALYAGLNWVSGLRDGLNQMLELPTSETGNIVKAKGTDLVTLVVLGFILLLSVSVGGLPVALGTFLLDLVGLPGPVGTVLLTLLSVVVGLAVSTVLFWAIFRLLPKPDLPEHALWRGASSVPVASLAIALTLVVWIYFFSRLVMYGISWACTDESTLAELAELEDADDEAQAVRDDDDDLDEEPVDVGYVRPLVVGLGLGTLLGAVLGRSTRDD
ncbi:YihY/virulence factor BrkB family protein [Aeromicrobium sp. REDSEA-S32_B7]|uniref:YihY/virulence factor BrkB family protein n=1 Tax=Aeromicrobium sp. REDSEA-S32_B7 TaxID=1811526 RepID=UPI000B2BE382|nr:YihY/virulence factor BrkB family protein [Aeromicrobium sp. REDSEA-S32_B7]